MKFIDNKLIGKRIIFYAALPLCMMLVSLTAHAQGQTVDLPKADMTLTEVFSEITWQTKYTFFFNPAKIDLNKKVALNASKAPLAGILEDMGKKTEYMFQIVDTHIIVIPPSPYDSDQELISAKKVPADFDYLPSYDAKGGNNEVFVIEMNYLAERSRNALRRERPELDPDAASSRDTLWSFIPPAPDRQFSYPDQNISLDRTGTVSDGGRFSSKLPSGAIKVNLLYGALTLTPNIAYEFGLGDKTSLDVTFAYNPWDRETSNKEKNRKMVHIIARPEFRYWLCERFNGHFFGGHAFYWRYNVSGYKVPMLFEKDRQYDGHALGLGVSYGYMWRFHERWGAEFNVGVGVAFMKHYEKECHLCAPKNGKQNETYFGPTNLGIKLVWTIN